MTRSPPQEYRTAVKPLKTHFGRVNTTFCPKTYRTAVSFGQVRKNRTAVDIDGNIYRTAVITQKKSRAHRAAVTTQNPKNSYKLKMNDATGTQISERVQVTRRRL